MRDQSKMRCSSTSIPSGAAQKALQRKRSESYLNCGKEAETPSLTEDQNSAALLRCGVGSLPPVPSSLLQIFSNCPLPGIGETEKKRQEGPCLDCLHPSWLFLDYFCNNYKFHKFYKAIVYGIIQSHLRSPTVKNSYKVSSFSTHFLKAWSTHKLHQSQLW